MADACLPCECLALTRKSDGAGQLLDCGTCCRAAYDTKDYRGASRVPIGSTLANLRCYVLDVHLQLVPVGVPGELMVSGIQVARGYLHRPELTAEKFINNPYAGGDAHHGRMYRTGALLCMPAAFRRINIGCVVCLSPRCCLCNILARFRQGCRSGSKLLIALLSVHSDVCRRSGALAA